MRANQHETLMKLVCPACHLVIAGRAARPATVEALTAHYKTDHPEQHGRFKPWAMSR